MCVARLPDPESSPCVAVVAVVAAVVAVVVQTVAVKDVSAPLRAEGVDFPNLNSSLQR